MGNHVDNEDYHSEMGKLKGAKIDSHRLPPLQSVNQPPEDSSHEVPQSLDRQTSIYSLTLGEFQTSLSRSKKEFGSMSMDDYYDSIFKAKENQSEVISQSEEGMMILSDQPIFPRQVLLNIPQPLICCRTVEEEVCAELQNDDYGINELLQNTNTVQHPKSFRPMTLDDFLDKAGLTADPQGYSYMLQPPQQPPQQQLLEFDPEPNIPRVPVMETGGCVNISSPNPQTAPGNGNGKRKGRGPQRNKNLSVQNVADRRHKRLLMNRASATRSRERKQAYTVDCEEELAFLREENERLSQSLAELEGEKQLQMQHDEEEAARATANMKTKSHKVNEKLKAMRRSYSCTAEATCIKWRLMPT